MPGSAPRASATLRSLVADTVLTTSTTADRVTRSAVSKPLLPFSTSLSASAICCCTEGMSSLGRSLKSVLAGANLLSGSSLASKTSPMRIVRTVPSASAFMPLASISMPGSKTLLCNADTRPAVSILSVISATGTCSSRLSNFLSDGEGVAMSPTISNECDVPGNSTRWTSPCSPGFALGSTPGATLRSCGPSPRCQPRRMMVPVIGSGFDAGCSCRNVTGSIGCSPPPMASRFACQSCSRCCACWRCCASCAAA